MFFLYEIMEEMGPGKVMFLVAIILGIILFAGIIFIQKFENSGTKIVTISKDALLTGANFELEAGDYFVINFVDGEHNFEVREILKTKIRLREGLIYHVLLDESSLDLDFDQDGFIDAIVYLDIKVPEERINLHIIAPTVDCVESWECSDWGPCINYVKKRVCVDQRSCGTEIFKPDLEMSC